MDPIESHGSMEMSTTKFKSMQGKRFVNSENATATALEDSNKTQQKTGTAEPVLEKKR